MDSRRFRALSPRQRALTAMAVLLDGFEAVSYLETDAQLGESLGRISTELAQMEPELRMALLGVSLRDALEELRKE